MQIVLHLNLNICPYGALEQAAVKEKGNNHIFRLPKGIILGHSSKVCPRRSRALCQGRPGLLVNSAGWKHSWEVIQQQVMDETSLFLPTGGSNRARKDLSGERGANSTRGASNSTEGDLRTAELGWIRWPDRFFPRFNLFNSLSFP